MNSNQRRLGYYSQKGSKSSRCMLCSKDSNQESMQHGIKSIPILHFSILYLFKHSIFFFFRELLLQYISYLILYFAKHHIKIFIFVYSLPQFPTTSNLFFLVNESSKENNNPRQPCPSTVTPMPIGPDQRPLDQVNHNQCL